MTEDEIKEVSRRHSSRKNQDEVEYALSCAIQIIEDLHDELTSTTEELVLVSQALKEEFGQ